MKFCVLCFPLLFCLQNRPFIEYPWKTRLDWGVDRYLTNAREKQCLTPGSRPPVATPHPCAMLLLEPPPPLPPGGTLIAEGGQSAPPGWSCGVGRQEKDY